MNRWIVLAALCALATGGCNPADQGSKGNPEPDSGTDTGSDSESDTGTGGEQICDPGEVWCYNDWVAVCNEWGTGWEQTEDCEAEGLVCAAGECQDISQECADAINEKSYIGCDYWGVTLANGVNSTNFHYAIAVANRGEQDAHVTVEDGAAITKSYVVPANDIIVIEDLGWKFKIKQPRQIVGTATVWATRRATSSAFHVTSDLPVTVYQFSPLNYCWGECTDIETDFSYTNDASMLLPSHVYRDEYIVLSRPTLKVIDNWNGVTVVNPGLFAVVGVGDEEATIEVEVHAHTFASDNLSNEEYPAYAPGDTFTTTIKPHEVLQVLATSDTGCPNQMECGNGYQYCCDQPIEYDLTGSVIRVLDGPNPAVFGGTDCSFVPWNKFACDHIEQQMFPLETWGTRYLCAHHQTQAEGEPTFWRVMSGSDENEIEFIPTSVFPNVSLNKGDYIEFEALEDFEVVGQGRVAVARFMVGQNYTSDLTPPENGDPAMSLEVPVEQYREDYTFLAPTTYVHNYLTIVHETGVFPVLDGAPVTSYSSSITYAINDDFHKTEMEIDGGIHYIESDSPFAIQVYGVGRYTSYMYPGGLDLAKVDIDVQ
jgi:hypothetical protein